MTRLHLLFMHCCSSLLAVTICLGVDTFTVDGHSCVSAYWNTVTCVLKISGDPVEGSNYSLKFIETDWNEEISCPLTVMNNTYSCVCELKDSSNTFGSYDEYNIEVCRDSRCHLLRENFEPSQNIKLTPPLQAEVQQSPETYNFTWTSGYEKHPLKLAGILDYELLLQTCHSKESNTLSPNSHETSLSVPRSQPKADAACCIKVRSIPGHRDYEGTWSDWSPSKCWENDAGEEQADTLAILTKSLGPVLVSVGVLLFVFYSPTARKKIKTLSHTPSPAPFFKPLFQQHDGNLQEWLSPQGKLVLTYKTDKLLTPNAVIVVAKPKTKEPEENQDFHNPSVPQMEFTQCQTAYVGLPGLHEVSLPLTMDSPGYMSSTEWLCSVWGVDHSKVEVVSSPPEDLFSITSADSICSCEDPTQSPECSSPHSPAVDNPLPCNYNAYCILNKTAGGFAPVLLSKGSRLNITSNSLQEDKS